MRRRFMWPRVPDNQTVYHHLDGMLLVLIQLDGFTQIANLLIHPHAHISGAAHVLKDVLVLAFASPYQRREQHQPSAIGQAGDGIDDLLHRLLAYLTPALWAVWMA